MTLYNFVLRKKWPSEMVNAMKPRNRNALDSVTKGVR